MERVDANLIPFAKNNPSGYRFAFGTDTATDDINVNYNDNIKKGWGTTPNEFPEVEDFNAMAYTTSYLIAYLYQMGISEWNDKQKYRANSMVIGSDGNLYKSLTGTSETPNTGTNPLSDVINWKSLNSDFVTLTGNQTIAGIKTFSSFPITPSLAPTTNYQVANKKYVDDKLVASSETVAGIIELATTAEAQAGTDDLRAITPLKLKNSVLGLGQTWQNVTSSRVSGTTYTNSTGKPIQVSISSGIASGGATITFTIDGITITRNFNGANAGFATGFDIIVPNGSTYSSTLAPIVKWLELR